MISTDTVVGSGMKLTCSQDELRREARRSSRAASRRGLPSRSWRGSCCAPRTAGSQLAATDMELSLRAVARGAGRRRRRRRRAGPAAGRHRAPAARRRGRARARAEEGVLRVDVRLGELPPEHVLRRGLPAPARGRAGRAARDRPRRAARDGRPRQPRRVARRVAPGAHRHPRPLRGRQARDGRDRLVPAVRQGDGARGRRRPSSRRSSRRARSAELARIAQGGDEIELGVHENQVVFGADGVWLTTRRIDGQFPNYKQLLPEAFEHEVVARRARSCSTSSAASRSWRSATRRCGCASPRAS